MKITTRRKDNIEKDTQRKINSASLKYLEGVGFLSQEINQTPFKVWNKRVCNGKRVIEIRPVNRYI